MKWIGQNIYDQVSKFRNTVDFSEDVTFYQPVNNANPNISIGSSDDLKHLQSLARHMMEDSFLRLTKPRY